MQTTAKRIAANQANALLSTGPKTPEGKAAVARNAFKHGLRAERLILEESAEAFAAFADSLYSHLAPENPLEDLLAQRIVAAAWRLDRVPGIEREVFTTLGIDRDEFAESPESEFSYAGDHIAVVRDSTRDLKLFEKLNRYEAHLYRCFERDLAQLERLRARRVPAEGLAALAAAIARLPDPSPPANEQEQADAPPSPSEPDHANRDLIP